MVEECSWQKEQTAQILGGGVALACSWNTKEASATEVVE